jgi:DNA repair exonuclease SbcCD ATPase subunit
MNKGQIVAALISAGTSAFTGVYALHQANKARNDREGLESDLNTLEENRQQIVNPYANVANQYANLGVATQAAEFQAEQADIALANTLDAVRQTGAGGATALAQAALQSKKGISAGLEKQELANEQLRARGAMEAQKLKAAGEQFKWQQQEIREVQKLDRTQAQIDQERMNQMQMRASAISSFTDIASNAASLAGVSSSSTNNVTSMGDFMSNTGSSYDEAANIAQAASTLGSVF